MSTAAWTVIGVFVGAALQFFANLLSERRADRRAEADREEARDARETARKDAREARLFDARRDAYGTFLSVARGMIERLWVEGRDRVAGSPRTLTIDFLDDMNTAWSMINLYGSPTALETADQLTIALVDFANLCQRGPEDQKAVEEHADRVTDLLDSFAICAREDVGAV